MFFSPNQLLINKNNCQQLADIYTTITGESVSYSNDYMSITGKPGNYSKSIHTKDLFFGLLEISPTDFPPNMLDKFLQSLIVPVVNKDSIEFDVMLDIIF